MPDLRPWPEADGLLDAALALPPGDRRAFLEQAVGDRSLRAALALVLDEAARRDPFLQAEDGLARLLEVLTEENEPAETEMRLGPRFAHFEVTGTLGRGGMGEVYRARDPRLERDVALKVLPEPFADDPDRLARFRREARLLASLNHPNVGSIYGLEEDGGVEALVLELVEGPTLAERIAEGPLSPDEALPIARQVAAALGVAHRLGIVHRDLKPANVKITASGLVKVLDFGLARVAAEKADERRQRTLPEAAVDVSIPGHVMGTAAYMSPEQACGEAVDPRADIWAFGCVLFEMLAGRRLFSGSTSADVITEVLRRDPDLSALPGGTPEPLAHLIDWCLQRDRTRRPANLASALGEVESLVAARRRRPIANRIPPRWLAWTAGLSALVAAFASRPRPPRRGASGRPKSLRVRISRKPGPHRDGAPGGAPPAPARAAFGTEPAAARCLCGRPLPASGPERAAGSSRPRGPRGGSDPPSTSRGPLVS